MTNLKNLKSFSNGPRTKVIALLAIIIAFCIASVIIVFMRKTLIINIDGKEQTLVTYKGTVQDVLNEQGIKIEEKDSIEPALNEKIVKNEIIKLKKAVPIKIICGDKEIETDTSEETVKDVLESESELLKENGIDFYEGLDEVSPNINSNIEKDSIIHIVNVEKQEVKEFETIPYETVVKEDNELMYGDKEVKTEGIDGKKEVTYEVVYKDGIETARQIITTKTISAPTNEVIVKGTGTILTANRGKGSAKKTISCSATAYTGHSFTSSGRKPCRDKSGISTIAVDPTVIPMGSKLYVEGYGYAVAADTGSAIKGNKIDVYFDSDGECSNWGRKQVQVKIIAYPGEW